MIAAGYEVEDGGKTFVRTEGFLWPTRKFVTLSPHGVGVGARQAVLKIP